MFALNLADPIIASLVITFVTFIVDFRVKQIILQQKCYEASPDIALCGIGILIQAFVERWRYFSQIDFFVSAISGVLVAVLWLTVLQWNTEGRKHFVRCQVGSVSISLFICALCVYYSLTLPRG